MSVVPQDRITATLYEPNGLDRVAWLSNARNVIWVEENSKPGWASFDVPLDDDTTSDITFHKIVRLTWWHAGVAIGQFAVRITSEAAQLATDGRRWLRFENQPGLLGLLADAVVYPEYGLGRDSGPDRLCGWMSAEGPWYIADDWVTPHGDSRFDDVHRTFPDAFTTFDPDAEWISYLDPQTTQPTSAYNYFRATLTLPSTTEARVLWTADNFPDFYIDGELFGSWGPPDTLRWKTGYSNDIHLEAGEHEFAIRVRNGRPVPGRNNPIAFLMSVREIVNADGDLGDVLLNSNTSDWLVHGDSPDPGWHRAQVLRQFVIEAKNRGGTAVDHLLFGFGDRYDSHGEEWTDHGQYRFAVAQVPLSDVATQLSESVMDVWVRPASMRLHAAKRRNTDKTGTVALTLGSGATGTLKSFESRARSPRFTTLLTQIRDGSWVETVDSDAVADWGRVEAGMTLGGAGSAGTANRVANAQLAENAHRRVTVTSEASTLAGAIPYLDYKLGDSITVPGRRNVGTMKARVLAITVDGTSDVVRAWPEYVEDLSL